jgi:glutamyl-tRNA synthetase
VSVLEFKEQGYLPQALLNYLVRLGWSHGDKEIFSIDEMINEFNLEDVSRGTSAFDYEKLSWLNQHYLKNTPIEALVPLLKPIYEKNDVKLAGGPDLLALIPLLTERSISLNEVVDKSHYFFQDDVSYDEKAIKKHLKPAIVPVLESIVSAYQSLSDWETSPIHEVIIAIAEKYELKMGKVAQPIRVAVTGSTMSPSIDVTLKLIGKERTIRRLTHAIDLASNNIN